MQALAPQEQFPILQSKNYLASHSLGAMPAATPQDLQHYCKLWAEQGILAWDGEWWEILADFGQRLERILQAPAQSIVPCLNVTLGFAVIASCLRFTRERPKVVLCDLEFTTTLPFWQAQRGHGAEVQVIHSPDAINVPVELLEAAIDERTALVVSSHAYFRSGALQDVERLQRKARSVGALMVVDAYQSAGCVPLNLLESDFDFLVGGCHKWLCGGPGGGFLYVRPSLVESLQPGLTGWFGLANPFAYEKTHAPTLHRGIYRFLNGTPNVLALFAARAGLDWIERLGIQAIRDYSRQLTGWLMEQLVRRGMNVKSPSDPARRNGMLCVDFPGSKECQARLQEQNIVVDWRPDCGIRISPHFYTQKSDLERLLDALDTVVKL